MIFVSMKRAAAAALVGLVSMGAVPQAWAASQDYEFRLVKSEIKKGDAVIAVRLINKTTGQPVPDAVMFATRLDMEPEGMQEMVTKVTPVPSSEPGVYQFKANLSMAGGWQLSLGAKIQGETGSLENKLVFKAVP
jgi:YtkA-like